jgi:hypothetical protein
MLEIYIYIIFITFIYLQSETIIKEWEILFPNRIFKGHLREGNSL